jgi:hypothetical protein
MLDIFTHFLNKIFWKFPIFVAIFPPLDSLSKNKVSASESPFSPHFGALLQTWPLVCHGFNILWNQNFLKI